jgi:hypothetical protein
MPEHKHTPGPWEIQKADDAYCIASIGHLVIMPVAGKVKHDNSEADARLIAAAPELLEALEAMLEAYDDGVGKDWERPYWLKAHAAIAKATGQP